MTYLAAGHEIGACTPSSGNVHESTAAGTFDTATSRCSLAIGQLGDVASYAEWNYASTTTTPNFGFMAYAAEPGFGGEYEWIHLLTSAGVVQIRVTGQRIDGTGSGNVYLRMYYLSGASWVQLGATTLVEMNVLQKIDFSGNFGASGYFQMYVAKTLIIDSGTVNLSGLSAIAKHRVRSVYGTNFVSEMVVSTASTVRLRLYTRYPIGSGSDTAWTGTYTDVDETVYSDVDGLESGTATQVETVTGSSTTLGGFAVEAVVVAARAALGTTGPTKVELVINSPSDSTNHFSSDVTLTAGYSAAVGIWATDPGTSAAWTATNASTTNFGVKSIA